MYTLGFNYTTFLYKEGEMRLTKNFSLFLANAISNMGFEDESRIFDSRNNLVVFYAKNYSLLLINDDLILGSWRDFEVYVVPRFHSYLKNEFKILYGSGDFFSFNRTGFYLLLNGTGFVLRFNVQISSIGNCLFIRVYGLRNHNTVVLDDRFLIKVSSIRRLFRKYYLPDMSLKLTLINGDTVQSCSLTFSSSLVFVLFEVIELEVCEV